MIRINQIVSLLKSKLTCKVYTDLVPEGLGEPAVAITDISRLHNRVIEGSKYGGSGVFRVTVVAKSTNDVESIVESIEKLDNTRSVDFQRVQAWLVTMEPKGPKQTYRRAFVDVQVYN